MFERSVPILRILCGAFGALLLIQFSRLAAHQDPLKNVTIPAAALSAPSSSTNTAPAEKNTNPVPSKESRPVATNVPPARKEMNPAGRMMAIGPGQGPGVNLADLPPAIRMRVERITQSEILGPVQRPLPMALLGIAGHEALLRAPNGQTGLIQEGAELGGIKLLRLGTNRVLIEHEGQEKELTIFSGLGSETLLPKGKEKSQ